MGHTHPNPALRSTSSGKSKVEREARLDPPIKTGLFLSDRAMILIWKELREDIAKLSQVPVQLG